MGQEYVSIRRMLYKSDSTKRPQDLADSIYQSRITSPATFSTNISFDGKHQLFIAQFNKMATLNERILRHEIRVHKAWDMLPGIAKIAYLQELLANEMLSTTRMEGVRSTRKEVTDALVGADVPNSQKRFREFARLYLDISSGSAPSVMPSTLSDLREIYDKVTKGEVSAKDHPDGEYFRANEVFIQDEGSGKIIHSGILPESNIQVQMTKMLDLTKDEDVPMLLRALLCHYVFEYAHPFYDGNGRTGRYLLALQLSDFLSVPTAVSISPVISENKVQYYKAFEEAEDPLNCGEISFFVYRMMKFIANAQDTLLEDLEGKLQALGSAMSKLTKLVGDKALDSNTESILNVLIQEMLFRGGPSTVTRRVLMREISVGWSKINGLLDNLVALRLVDGTGRRNRHYSLTSEAKELLLGPSIETQQP